MDLSLAEPERSGFVELNRTRLRVWEWGAQDAPVVVCVHGAYDHGRMWDGIAPRLAADGYRVVAPDLRGHGDSGPLANGHLWAVSALDLGLLCRELGPDVGLIGHSFGGGQALYVAACWPELVRWVVNLDGLGPPAEAFEERDMAESVAKSLDTLARMRARPPRVYATLAEMEDRRRQVNVRLPAEWVTHLVRHGAVEVEGGFRWKADPLFSVGFPGDFGIDHLHAEHAIVRCPVLVLTGGETDTWSELSDDELADRLRHLPDVRHQVVGGAGHYVHIEQPEVVLEAIGRFVAEVEHR